MAGGVASLPLVAGQVHGRLTLVGRAESNKNGHARWLCRCACGADAVVFATNIRRGLTASCGCAGAELSRARSLHSPDLAGQKFGRLTALDRALGERGSRWRCQCDCGETSVVRGILLLNGNTRSCGCLSKESSAAVCRSRATHGGRDTPEYGVWWSMRQRCDNPANKAFANYGGRGIRVCERWQSFENFRADMGMRPSDELSIDRIDNDGNYEPGNCRWATAKEQRANQRPRSAVPA